MKRWSRYLFWVALAGGFVWAEWFWYPVSVYYSLQALGFIINIAVIVFLSIIQFVAIFWFLSRGRVYWIMPGETGATWDDYRGNPEVVATAKRIVTLLRGVKDFREMGGETIRGLLLAGPPGTGKSYLAQVIANEAGVPFCYASAPSFQNMFIGVGQLRVMYIYRKARKKAEQYGACVLFIDEIDAIGAARANMNPMAGGMFGGGLGILNELLMQMDPPNIDNSWFVKLLRILRLRRRKADRPAVLTIGATNMPDVLDPALVRPGRFDRQLWVDAPDFDGRVDVFDYYLKKVKTAPDMTAQKAALDTVHYSPARIKHVVNESVVMAHQRGSNLVTYDDFRAALETHEWGLRQPLRSMAADERRAIAYHEAGHAVAQYLLLPHWRLWKVTIVRHGGALGLAAPKPTQERYTETDTEILADIKVSLAARASEELFLGTKLTGVTGDLQSATFRAAQYLGLCGMGEELFSFGVLGRGAVNPDSVKGLRPAINQLLSEQMTEVKSLLAANAEFVHAIAEALIERNDLTGDEVDAIYKEITASRGEPI